MTITGHLNELRQRLTRIAIVYILLALVCFLFIEKFVDVALAMSPDFSFVYLSPSELFTSYMKLALILGLVFASPFILWQIWGFIRPGLTKEEGKNVQFAVAAGFGCFLLGAVFCAIVILPVTLQFFYSFNGSTEITASISFNNYMNFILGMLVAFGAVFEMPVLIFLLSSLGLIKPAYLVSGRKIAIVLVFLLAALITPPDVLSQLMTAVPMLALYELSIFVCRKAYKTREAKNDEESDEEDSDE